MATSTAFLLSWIATTAMRLKLAFDHDQPKSISEKPDLRYQVAGRRTCDKLFVDLVQLL
jgi:hypothetical protein